MGKLTGLICLAALAAMPAAQQTESASQEMVIHSSYILGPDDQLVIRALDAEEISDKPVRIDLNGSIRLPLAGRVQAAGLTVEQLEKELKARLKTYIKEPQVVVSITEFRSQPVSVLGAVRNPGVHQVQGRKSLLETLSMAGGIDTDAGHSIKITRRSEYGSIPLPSAQPDDTGNYTVADVDLASLLDARNPKENIEVKPHDVITIPRGDLVYVMGQVRRPGGFVLRQRETLSALQALSLAEGLDRAAAPQNARILRTVAGAQQRSEIYIDLKKILGGQSPDVPLVPNDVLFIPNNAAKNVLIRGLETAVSIGTGVAIYRGR